MSEEADLLDRWTDQIRREADDDRVRDLPVETLEEIGVEYLERIALTEAETDRSIVQLIEDEDAGVVDEETRSDVREEMERIGVVDDGGPGNEPGTITKGPEPVVDEDDDGAGSKPSGATPEPGGDDGGDEGEGSETAGQGPQSEL